MAVGEFENLKAHEQVRLASAADVLVGVHGAGLFHLMSMRMDSVVGQFVPASSSYKYWLPIYRLAAATGVRAIGYPIYCPDEREQQTMAQWMQAKERGEKQSLRSSWWYAKNVSMQERCTWDRERGEQIIAKVTRRSAQHFASDMMGMLLSGAARDVTVEEELARG